MEIIKNKIIARLLLEIKMKRSGKVNNEKESFNH